MNKRLFAVRDDHMRDAFSAISERRRILYVLWCGLLSLLIFALYAGGLVDTLNDLAAVSTVVTQLFLAPAVAYIWFRFYTTEVRRAMTALPVFSLQSKDPFSPGRLLVWGMFFSAGSLALAMALRFFIGVWGSGGTELWLFFAVMFPLVEELVFRFGLLYSLITVFGTATGIVVSALIFAGFHATGVSLFLSAFVLGMLLAVVVIRYGSLLPAVLFHMIFNATAYLT